MLGVDDEGVTRTHLRDDLGALRASFWIIFLRLERRFHRQDQHADMQAESRATE